VELGATERGTWLGEVRTVDRGRRCFMGLLDGRKREDAEE
jgi:hypothetical protein